jgi:hypothetical protein
MAASTRPPLSVWPCCTPFGNTQERTRDWEREVGEREVGSCGTVTLHVYTYARNLVSKETYN